MRHIGAFILFMIRRAVATPVLLAIRFAVLAIPNGNSGLLSGHAGLKQGAPFQRALPPSIGKWTD